MGGFLVFILIVVLAVIIIKSLKSSSNSETKIYTDKADNTIQLTPQDVLFLEEIPSEGSDKLGEKREGGGLHSILNHSVGLYEKGNYKDAVRWMNMALKTDNLPCDMAIALHRNRSVAINEYVGFGTGKPPKNNLSFCIAVEHMVNDIKAIIGLFVTNEDSILKGDHTGFFRDSFNMALSSYMPLGLSNMAYQEGTTYRRYKNRLTSNWEISFVNEPKNALRVNGEIYPQHLLPK